MSLNSYLDHSAGMDVVPSNSVSSMFSPAAYLSELYEAAKTLHKENSAYHLEKRRPDLGHLVLSQENMDKQQPTLSIISTLLSKQISQKLGFTDSENNLALQKMLASYRFTDSTPYHHPYSVVRQSLLQKDPQMTVIADSPVLTSKLSSASILSIYKNISPELYSILTEEITGADDKIAELVKKNFGDTDITTLYLVKNIARYYDLNESDLAFLNGLFHHRTDGANCAQYTNGYFTTLNTSGKQTSCTTLQCVRSENAGQFSIFELIPTGGDQYTLNLCASETKDALSNLNIKILAKKDPSTNEEDTILFDEKDTILVAGKLYRFDVTIAEDKFVNGLTISVDRISPHTGGYFHSTTKFYRSTAPLGKYLLKLNKIIRLYKALSLPGNDFMRLSEASDDFLSIDAAKVNRIGLTIRYQQKYGISMAQARILAGSNISQAMIDNQSSEFTSLFTLTSANGDPFSADEKVLELEPGKAVDTFRIASLCKAFGVNSIELYTLWEMTRKEAAVKFTCTIDNLSALYRVSLLAHVHGLSVTSLQNLLNIAELPSQPGNLNGDELASLVGTLNLLTSWLAETGLTAEALYSLLAEQYTTILTPDTENLLTTLQNNITETSLTGDILMTRLAPLVAAEMQLSTASLAKAVLQWFNQYPPMILGIPPDGETALDVFWQKVGLTERTDNDTAALVACFQRIGQFSLLIQTLGLSSDELSLFVNAPQKLNPKLTTLKPVVETIYQLSRFHRWLQQSGKNATKILTSLAQDLLTADSVACMSGQNTQMVQQAANLATDGAETLASWSYIDAVDQFMSAATSLGITPDNLQKLLKLDFVNQSTTVTFDTWLAASQVLVSALDDNQAQIVTRVLNESYCDALSAYYISNLAPDNVTSRDKLYDWLLLDPLTAGDVMTTPIAAAIASLQLYVNRVLNGIESDPDHSAQTSTFFARWNQYNKAYDTWAGGKKLAYYPENYINPTVRIGQTKMISDMLQTLSQNELSEDTVATAFNAYMADFEKIANLSVICCYHDGVDLRSGLTWFIGQSSTDKNDFYWRTLDQSLIVDGKYPANAWSEWVKINTAITPYNGLIKPVVFDTRLYLVWVEELTESKTDTNNVVTSTPAYKMKWSWKLHNGSWATPQERKLEEALNTEHHLYCTYDNMHSNIAISLYHPGGSEEKNKTLDPFLVATINADNKLSTFEKNSDLLRYIYPQLDIDQSNMRVARTLTKTSLTDIHVSDVKETTSIGWGDSHITNLSKGRISTPSLEPVPDGLKITFDADVKIDYQGYNGDVSSRQTELLKYYQKHKGKDDTGDLWFSKSDDDSYHILGNDVNIYVYNTNNIYKTLLINELYDFMDFFSGVASGKLKDHVTVLTAPPGISKTDAKTFKNHVNNECRYNFFILTDKSVTGYNKLKEMTEKEINDKNESEEYNEFNDSLDEFYNLSFPDRFNGTISNRNVKIDVTVEGNTVSFTAADKSVNVSVPDLNFDGMTYSFTGLNFIVSDKIFTQSKLPVYIHFSVKNDDDHLVGYQDFSFDLEKPYFQFPVTLHHEKSGVQYIENPPYRTRLNTLFAQKLVSKAAAGLDSVLSVSTQEIQEPILGEGTYVKLIFDIYDPKIHGESLEFKILRPDVLIQNGSAYPLFSGQLSKTSTTEVKLFLPRLDDDYGDTNNLYLCAQYGDRERTSKVKFSKEKGVNQWYVDSSLFKGLADIGGLSETSESMDFSGSSALYFWEMFYYVPMMVFQRMLDEQRYDDASNWITYIWNPGGYTINGSLAPWLWNVRPLEEDTSWNSKIPDTYDPDAVAQSDPMHYKAATVMKSLDLMIARGDKLFRELTTDALTEAKMWYEQAQNTLGTRDLSLSSVTNWDNEKLSTVVGADQSPFLSEQNEQIDVYLQTLAQRMYNLRHNLSIDGQPLNLSVYSTPADPKALQAAAVVAASGGSDLPAVDFIPQYRFPIMLQDARSMVGQLSQFGSTLLSVTERQDAEAMAELLQTQGSELALQAIAVQQKAIEEIDADIQALKATQKGTQTRLNSYQTLCDENISSSEQQAINLNTKASQTAVLAGGFHTAGAALDMAPNIFGLADGGSRWGAILSALGMTTQIGADVLRMESEKISQSEMYRRRHQEWAIQRDIAKYELEQISAQLNSLSVRREGASLQKTYQETQQKHMQTQLSFLQSKFSNKALYSWMKGKLASIYYQFYDLTVSRCLMAEKSYRQDTGEDNTLFIRTGAWQGTYAGLLAGETLSLNLAQMEAAYIKQETRALEVMKTVSLEQYYDGLSSNNFVFSDEISKIISVGKGSVGTADNGLSVQDGALNVNLKLSDLCITDDYPANLGDLRRIKQISVTLPALLGPYQDVRAILSYGGSVMMPKGCNAVAVSHGMNDSGLFQLNFEDSRYLPFEGIPINDSGTLTLSFPDMAGGQKDLLLSLRDVILHIAYTIRS